MATLNREQMIDRVCKECGMNETQKRVIRKVLRGYDKVRCDVLLEGNKIKEPFGTIYIKKRNTNNNFNKNKPGRTVVTMKTSMTWDFRDKLIENLVNSDNKDLYSE